MNITKEWDWSKNKSAQWVIPCNEAPYLAERWASKGHRQFLDLGCGLGRHAIYMSQKGFEVTAVDLSDYGIDHLRNWATREHLSIETKVCNMLDLPFEDNSFDCVMAYNVIYHTNTQGFMDALREIKRILRPDGELFLTMISKNTWSFQHAENYRRIDDNTIIRDEDETERDVPHFYVGANDLKKLFADWTFAQSPKEWCDYNLDAPEFFSKHWQALLVNDPAR